MQISNQAPPFRILGFRTKGEIRNGKPHFVEYVDVCAPGQSQRTATPLRIVDVMRVREDGDPDNPAWQMAKMKRDLIKPAYEAWKAGQDLPVHGTPLAAWSGLTSEQVEVLRSTGLRTIEELANATESIITRTPLPNMRSIVAQAKMFLDSRDQSRVVADLARKDAELEAMRAQLEEMKELMLSKFNDDEAPRKGRPRRVEAVPDAETAAA